MIINCALINSETGMVENTIVVDTENGYTPPDGFIIVELPDGSTISSGWSYINGEFVAPPQPPLTDEQVISANTGKLQQESQLATAQKAALTNRVGTLNDAIELEMATPEEVAELPVRQAQLLDWKRYAIFLGRVTLQSGWALTVEWPIKPTAGMDLSVSSAAPESS